MMKKALYRAVRRPEQVPRRSVAVPPTGVFPRTRPSGDLVFVDYRHPKHGGYERSTKVAQWGVPSRDGSTALRAIAQPSDAVSENRRIPLRGVERFGIAVDGVSIKCSHTFLVSGDVDTLLRFLPAATMNVFNRHPRMRAQLAKDERFTAEILPPVTLEDVSERCLVRVREFGGSKEDAEAWENWGKFVQEECSHGFHRYTQFMFYLSVWANQATGKVRLMLFSDHIMSDGDSGFVIINDIMEQVALLSKGTPEVITELPLRPSLYDMWFSSPRWVKPFAKTVLAVTGKKTFIEGTKAFTPLLPPRSDQHDFGVPFKHNSTHAFFAEGDPECMQKTLARCKEMGVSFTGAMIPMTAMAFYTAKERKNGDEGVFRMGTQINYNLRKRVPQPAEETQVGLYATVAELSFLSAEGVDLKTTKFWDFARQARKKIVEHGKHPLMGLPLFMMDRKIHAESAGAFLGDYRVKNSITGDVNISSVGRYPFPTEHRLAGDSVLKLDGMHTFAAVPFVGTTATLWVSSLNAFSYSLGHKVEDDVGKKLLDTYVTVCEDAGSIGEDETMLGVLKRMELL